MLTANRATVNATTGKVTRFGFVTIENNASLAERIIN
jgi:hypothetical protein